MLLFSTILDIKNSVTEEDFLNLVLEWNRTSSHPENIVRGIDWHGERSARYGTQKLWLEFAESPDERIIAVRHEKTADDGVVWDSDFILNFKEMRLAIQPGRSDILEDILEHNTYYHLKEERKQRRKGIPVFSL